jgi:hypothetical protein
MMTNAVHLVSKWKYPICLNRCQELSNGRLSLEETFAMFDVLWGCFMGVFFSIQLFWDATQCVGLIFTEFLWSVMPCPSKTLKI